MRITIILINQVCNFCLKMSYFETKTKQEMCIQIMKPICIILIPKALLNIYRLLFVILLKALILELIISHVIYHACFDVFALDR